jgi:3-oxoacyl-(acyl-carrier-protein) synthase
MNGDAVWITGVGAVSAAGPDTGSLRELLCTGATAVSPDPALHGLDSARVPDLPRRPAGRRLDRSAQLFIQAAEEAWAMAGLEGTNVTDAAVIEGSSLGPLSGVLETHRGLCAAEAGAPHHPSALVKYLSGAGGAWFAQHHGIAGDVFLVSAGSVSGTLAVIEAARRVRSGEAPVAVAGGCECPLEPDLVATFDAAGILTHEHCRPFDYRHSGTVLGEGAGVVILESAAHAAARGARPLARLLGWATHTEHAGMTSPDPSGEGVASVCGQALARAHAGPPVWIKAHGTGTALNDHAESIGLFRELGPALDQIPVAALKPSLGHLLGASGALEVVATVLAMEEDLVPATVGFESGDPSGPSLRVCGRPHPADRGPVLLLSESFGGRCAALVVG